MSDRTGWLITGLVLVVFIAFVISISNADADKFKVCSKAGYDGYKTIENQPFCYRVLDSGQIEYLRYDMLVRKE